MNRIKELIKESGYTQEEFAGMLGITRVGLAQQLSKPSYPTLEKMSKALDVPMWQLFASPYEIQSESDFTAMVKDGKDYYSANTLSELEKIVSIIKEKQ